jgi:hypothetical protein
VLDGLDADDEAQQLAAVNLQGDPFHPEWNYVIAPTKNER